MPLYFAYGSNMYTKQMHDRGINPTAAEVVTLPGYRLVFNKKSMTRGGTGVANIEKTGRAEDKIEGILYTLSDADLRTLKGFEGGYNQEAITIGSRDVQTFIARTSVPGLKPQYDYVKLLLQGAAGKVTPAYFDKLLNTEIQEGGRAKDRYNNAAAPAPVAATPTPSAPPAAASLVSPAASRGNADKLQELLTDIKNFRIMGVRALLQKYSFNANELNQAFKHAVSVSGLHVSREQADNRPAIIQTLVEKGAQIDTPIEGMTAVKYALSKNRFDSVATLIRNGATYTQGDVVTLQSQRENPNIVKLLDTDMPQAVQLRQQATTLHPPSSLPSKDAVNIKDPATGNTALIIAAKTTVRDSSLYANRTQIVKALLSVGANPLLQNVEGHKARHYAENAVHPRKESAKLLETAENARNGAVAESMQR